MREILPEDYEKLARHIVDAFLDSDVSLATGVTKVAMEMEMNPHQIRNLTQLSNITAHLRLYEKKAEDKIVEFVPVNPREVIQNMFDDADTEKTASDDSYDQALDLYGDFGTKAKDVTMEKLAEDYEDPKPTRHPDHKSNMILRLRKVAEELNSNSIQHAQHYIEELDKLASEFAKLYGPDFRLFERDAIAKYGNLAVPTLNDIRSRLRLNSINLDTVQDMQKTARVVDDGTPEMQSFNVLLESAAQATNCARGVEYLKSEVGDVL
jgi:hypothetical protein